MREGAPFELVSRESGLVVNNLILSVILGIVFVGTLYPLFVEALSGEKLSVGAPYFNAVAGRWRWSSPCWSGSGRCCRWRRERRPVFKQLIVPALLGATALAITVILAPGIGILPRLGLAVAAFLAAASDPSADRPQPAARAARDLGHGRRSLRDRRRPAGMAANAAFTSEKLAVGNPARRSSVGPWLVQLDGVTPAAGKNWTAIEAELARHPRRGPMTQAADALFH